MSNFDQEITRRHTGSMKWDRRPDLDPLWVADMDFTSAPAVLDALHSRVEHGVFGYAQPHQGLVEAVHGYLEKRIGYQAEEKEIVHLGGLVPALSLSVRAFAEPGDAAMTCTPVYPPFLGVHIDGDLDLITCEHVLENERWTFDWEKMAAAVTAKTKVFILSNPQNPLGRVFTKEEITRLAEFCQKHGLILLSDEVHCDLIFDEKATPHFSALNLPEELRKNTVTLLSPSKTYNIAGLGYAFAVIPDDSLRRKFTATKGHTLSEINCLAYYAAEAAYKHGEPWRQELLAYLRSNRDLLKNTFREKIPAVQVPEIEATYLAWIDCTALDIESPAAIAEKAGFFLSDGEFFGKTGCTRINFGTQKARLQNALDRFCEALS